MDRRPLTVGCGVFFAAVVAAVGARAERAGRVLLAGTCMPQGARAEEVTLILSAELSPLRVEPLTPDNAGDAVAVLGIDSCTAAPLAARVSVWRDGERREREVVLSDAASGTESRTLALALAEALRDPSVTRLAPQAPVPWQAPSRSEPTTATPRLPDGAEAARLRPSSSKISPRTGVLFRFLPASSTPALGVSSELALDRSAFGVVVLGARKTVNLGTLTLLAFAGDVAFDAVAISSTTFVRVRGELGAAVGVGSPSRSALGHTHIAPNLALLAGIAQRTPLSSAIDLDLCISGGYASSLNADADGQRVAGLSGGFVSVEAAVRF
jgi:hypothetical protein